MYESLRRLLPYFKLFRSQILTMFLLGVGVAVVTGFVPVLIQLLVGVYGQSNLAGMANLLPANIADHIKPVLEDRETVAKWLPFAFPATFFVLGILRFLHNSTLGYTTERIISNVRFDLIRKILRLNLTYQNSLEKGTGGLMSRVFNDTAVLQQGLQFYATLVIEPIQAMIFLGYMFALDWRLTLGSLLFLPIFFTITRKVIKSLRKYGSMGRESMDDLTSVMKDMVDGVRVVQSFNLEPEMERRFQSSLQHYLNTTKKIIQREQAVSPLNEFTISFLLMAFTMYSINQVLGGLADASQFIGFIAAAGFLQAPIKKLQDAGVKIQQCIIITERVFGIIDSPSEVPSVPNPKPFPKNWKSITFHNVSFTYGREMVLKNINLTVNRGEVIALVGESGSGKSTLVNLLERFYDPTSGEILIDGIPINEFSLSELRQNIALVTQDVFLFRDSIARNIHAGDFSKDPAGIQTAAKLANADKFIMAMKHGYDSPVGERGSFLSGGEKQRVSIARAIFKDAPILILDEATSALDSVSEMEVQKGLNHLMENRTAFVIAHRFSTIFNANRILVMQKGEIVEEGSHQDLLAAGGAYHTFFKLQMSQDERIRQTSN